MAPWLLLALVTPPDLAGAASMEVARQECRSRDPSELLVCGRGSARERYRTADPRAPFDFQGNTMSVLRERSRWIEGGESGPQSCGAVGPGGWTGCMIQQWKRNDQQNPLRHRSSR